MRILSSMMENPPLRKQLRYQLGVRQTLKIWWCRIWHWGHWQIIAVRGVDYARGSGGKSWAEQDIRCPICKRTWTENLS